MWQFVRYSLIFRKALLSQNRDMLFGRTGFIYIPGMPEFRVYIDFRIFVGFRISTGRSAKSPSKLFFPASQTSAKKSPSAISITDSPDKVWEPKMTTFTRYVLSDQHDAICTCNLITFLILILWYQKIENNGITSNSDLAHKWNRRYYSGKTFMPFFLVCRRNRWWKLIQNLNFLLNVC